jgi:hypothetical protein
MHFRVWVLILDPSPNALSNERPRRSCVFEKVACALSKASSLVSSLRECDQSKRGPASQQTGLAGAVLAQVTA